MRRRPRILCWIFPLVFCLILYWPGLFAWFQQDDFAWLNLAQDLREGRSLWSAMFRPLQGQGSLRPLSERAYYLGLPALFGLNAFPFRLLAFLAQSGSLLLVIALVRRLSGSLVAGSLAAILWTANSKLFVVMSWSAEFMLVLCGTLLLLALNLFIKHIDTGEKSISPAAGRLFSSASACWRRIRYSRCWRRATLWLSRAGICGKPCRCSPPLRCIP